MSSCKQVLLPLTRTIFPGTYSYESDFAEPVALRLAIFRLRELSVSCSSAL